MARLNIKRQNKLEPERMQHAKQEIEKLGYVVQICRATRLEFQYKSGIIILYPYSGWHTGTSIKDGRGLKNLLNQIKQ